MTVLFLQSMRKRIDCISGKIDRLLSASRPKSLAITSLDQAFMWLGLELAAVGNPNPYPTSMDKSSPVIEKPTDKAETEESLFLEKLGGLDETGVTKALRLDIQRTIDILRVYFTNQNSTKKVVAGSYPINMSVDANLVNSKLWLGKQLNHILKTQEIKEEKLSD